MRILWELSALYIYTSRRIRMQKCIMCMHIYIYIKYVLTSSSSRGNVPCNVAWEVGAWLDRFRCMPHDDHVWVDSDGQPYHCLLLVPYKCPGCLVVLVKYLSICLLWVWDPQSWQAGYEQVSTFVQLYIIIYITCIEEEWWMYTYIYAWCKPCIGWHKGWWNGHMHVNLSVWDLSCFLISEPPQ